MVVRITVSIPDDLDRAIQKIRGENLVRQGKTLSYSKLVAIYIRKGMQEELPTTTVAANKMRTEQDAR